MHFSIINLIFLFIWINSSFAAEWNYGEQGPDVWSDRYPLCAGRAQSPIKIRTACTVYQLFPSFTFSTNYNQVQNFTLTNNGHTISGSLTTKDFSPLIIDGGGLEGTYQFSSFHFHWGENYKSGSEHQVNHEKYSGELHIIHMNPQTNQTAVFGIFIRSIKDIDLPLIYNNIKTNQTFSWENLFAAIDYLSETNESTTISLNLFSLIHIDFSKFWRYTGSLTTPPCTEGIIWSIFKQPIVVNDNRFRSFRDDIYPKDFRQPQPLNHRIVQRSFRHETTTNDNCWCRK